MLLCLLLQCICDIMFYFILFFFFKQKTAYEMRISDWSSDVCSSDLASFDGKKLGRHFRELRDPIKEFVVLGGMMVTLADVYALLGAMRSWKSFVHRDRKSVV